MSEPEDDHAWDSEASRRDPSKEGAPRGRRDRSTALPTSVPKRRLREMVERIDLNQLTIDAAAEELGIDVDSLHRYYRTHTRHHENDEIKGELNLSVLDRNVPDELRDTYTENWDRSAEMFEPEVIEPSWLARLLSLTPLTRWMVKDSRVERSSFTGVMTLLVLGAIVAIAIATNRNEGGENIAAEESEEAKAMPSRVTEAAEAAIRNFLEAESWEAKLPFVRHPEENRPRLEAWASEGNAGPTPYRFVFFEDVLEQHGGRFMRFSAMQAFGETPREIFVEVTEEPFRVDWQAFAVWQPLDWSAFLDGRPDGVFNFRVTASISEYYNYEFTDEEIWLSLELRPRPTDQPLYTFVDRRSPLGAELANVFLTQEQLAKSSIKVIVALSFSESPTKHDTVGIHALVSPNWLSP